ncbi:hypothetical protein BH23VER1_BH23VER1_02510 [soil metagenome]
MRNLTSSPLAAPLATLAPGAILVATTLAPDSARAEQAEADGRSEADTKAEAETQAKPEAKPEPEAAAPLDTIGMAGLQEAFRVLRERYIQRDQLTPTELNRAALQGILERLDFGATLVTNGGELPGIPSVFRAEMLADDIAYLRPSSFDSAEVELVDAGLADFADERAATLILDLRAETGGGNFEAAAAIADRFLPEGEAIFKLVRPGEDRPRTFLSRSAPSWTGELILLIDTRSSAAAEAVAAVLQSRTDAFVIGEPTPGKTILYEDVAIGDGLQLRIAVAEVVLPDGTTLFRRGIEPDFEVAGDPEEKARFFADADSYLANFVFERQRPRMNEAALVAGTNPELPYHVLRSAGEPNPWATPPTIDRVLQRAFDLLSTKSFLKAE